PAAPSRRSPYRRPPITSLLPCTTLFRSIRPVTVAGLLVYAAGLVWWGRALWLPARRRPPREFATASVGCALVWLGVGIGATIWLDRQGRRLNSSHVKISYAVVCLTKKHQ